MGDHPNFLHPTLILLLAKRLPKANAISAHAWRGRCPRLAPAAAPWGWVLARHQPGNHGSIQGCCCLLLLALPRWVCGAQGTASCYYAPLRCTSPMARWRCSGGFELSCSERFPVVILCPQQGASVRQALGKGPRWKGAVRGAPHCVLRLPRRGLVGYKEDWQRGREVSPSPPSHPLPPRPCVGTTI